MHRNVRPAARAVLQNAPDLKAAATCFEQCLEVGIAGDIELARQGEHGFHPLVFGMV
jgi:hypothetical protein